MSNGDLINKIKNHRLYRGQLLPYLSVKASKDKKDIILEDSIQYILSSLDISLFDFQLKSLKCFLDGANIYLSGGYGLGKSTTIDILAICELFTEGKSILYLVPSETDLNEKLAKTKSIFAKIKEFLPIHIVVSSSSLNLKDKLSEFPEVVISTSEVFYDLLRNYSHDKTIRDFLFSTGLIGVDKIDQYKPNEIIFLSKLISLLESLSCSRFVITSSSTEDLQSFINLFQKEIRLEPIEITEFKTDSVFNIWIPPFDVDLLEDRNTFIFKRNGFIQEVKKLINILDDLDNKKILIWYAYNNLTSKIKLDLSLSSDITITDRLAQLPIAGPREFDAVIMIGMARDFKNILHHVNNFVKDNGYIFIVPPDDLLSYLLMWSDFNLVHRLPGRKLFPFSETELLENNFDQIKKALSGKKITPLHSPYWGIISNDFIELRYPSGLKRFIDRSILPTNVHEGQLYLENEKRYLAKYGEGRDSFFVDLSTPGEDYATSAPILKFNISNPEEKGREKQSIFGRIKQISCTLRIDQEGYILFTDYSQECRSRIEFEEPFKFTKYTQGVRLKFDFPKEMDHSFYNYLPLLFANCLEVMFTFHDDEYVYIFPHQPEFFSFVDKYFSTDFESTIGKTLQFAYAALLGCPCEQGCSKCLYYPFHQETDGLNKEAFGLFIAKTYGREEVQNFQNLMDFRMGRISSVPKVNNYYNGIKERVIRVLQDNLDIEIDDPVPLIVDPTLEAGILGRYDGKFVRVIPLKELQAIQVITHEYIHNWEDKVGILSRNDKFISEGAAQWLSTKVLNYYYRIDEIEYDILGTKSQHLKEYFNGFQFLQEIEQKDGYINILNNIINDSWTDQYLKLRKKWEEYKPADNYDPKF